MRVACLNPVKLTTNERSQHFPKLLIVSLSFFSVFLLTVASAALLSSVCSRPFLHLSTFIHKPILVADENSGQIQLTKMLAEPNLADALVRMALEGGISYLTCVDVTWVVGDVTCLNKQLI